MISKKCCLLVLSMIFQVSGNEFRFLCQEITPEIKSRLVYTWNEESPVPLKDLCYLNVSHYDFSGNIQEGELVVHSLVANDLIYIFRKLFEAQFPIQSMKIVDEFGGSDDESMRSNNTSAFFARKVANTDRWSNHSYGLAIDINPLLNPYSSHKIISAPQEGLPYLDRTLNIPGMITTDSYIYSLFKELGWEWGGECFLHRGDGVIDRHHFQKVVDGINHTTNN